MTSWNNSGEIPGGHAKIRLFPAWVFGHTACGKLSLYMNPSVLFI
jgi:hypothetical protein